jgi:hypothetical protein
MKLLTALFVIAFTSSSVSAQIDIFPEFVCPIDLFRSIHQWLVWPKYRVFSPNIAQFDQ